AVTAALGMGEVLAQGTQTTSEAAAPNAPATASPNAPAATPPNAPATTSPDAPFAPSPDTPSDGQVEENATTEQSPSAMPLEDGRDFADAETTGAEVATSPLAAEKTQEPDAVATDPVAIDAEPVLEEDDFDFSDLEAEASDDFVSGPKLD